ncbi:hypothetical protein LIER_30534 [Lithospermum erythrorhizon]|uniref:Uncharacterized protein n=1 Tax=Lithospermum erythrorhizon TaxID=34254 RepID=A0AAV3RNZ0_LITER
MPTTASRRECKTKMLFTDRLDIVPLPKGFVLPQFTQFGRSGPSESLKRHQKRYNDILLTIPEVNNKVAYMAFYRGPRYGKLKKALVLETPLSKDQLTVRVKQYVELEELKTKEAKLKDLSDVLTRKRTRSKSPRKQPIWERIQQDREHPFKRR